MTAKSILFSTFLCLSSIAFSENLLTKESSGFECDKLPKNVKLLWGKPNEVQLTDEDSYTGNKSLKVNFNKKLLRVFIHTPEQNFKKGETYTISAFVKTSAANMNIGFFCTSYNKLWSDGAQTHKFESRPVTTDWRQIKMTAQMKRDGKLLGIHFLGKPGQVMFIDEVKIEKGKNATWSDPEKKTLTAGYQLKNPEEIVFDPEFGKKFAKDDWSQIKAFDKFIRTSGDVKKAPQKTWLQFAADKDYLYVRFVCEEQNLSAMKSKSLPNLPVWDDDRVELHFNFSGMKLRNDIKHFSVNSEGVYSTNFKGAEKVFSVKTKKGGGKWEVSYRLPLSDLGFQVVPGMCWKISAGRFHRTFRKETSAFAKTKFHFNRDTEAFLGFVLSCKKTGFPQVVLADAGEVTDYDNNTGGNALSFWVSDKLKDAGLNVRVNGKTAKVYSSGQSLTTFYVLSGVSGEKLAFEVLDKANKVLLKGGFDTKVFRNTERVYRTKAPFVFKEVFGNKRKKERVNITWTSVVDERNYRDALKTGVPYSQEKVFRELKDAGIRLIIRNGMSVYSKLPNIRKGNFPAPSGKPDMAAVPELLKRKLVLPVCHYSFYFIPGVDENGKYGTTAGETGFFGLMTDPINTKAYLQSVNKIMDVHGKDMDIFFLGDEVVPLNIFRGRVMNKPFNDQAFLKKWYNDVKTKEGDGRFGIPWDMKMTDPKFNPSERAFRSYMAEEIAKIAEKAAAIARKKKKDIVILSDDAHDIPSVTGVQHWSRYADCGSFQLGEAGLVSKKECSRLMFLTKMVKDVGLIDDLTVVIHEAVSGYPTGAMGQSEMLECYSQAVRGGATGFHFWPASMGQRYDWDGQSGSIVIGYPTGYKFMLAMTKTFNQMPDLKFPETETAFLVSDDSLMFSKKGFDYFQRAFIAIGEQIGGWFKFVSDTHLHRGEESLDKYKIVYVPYASYLKKETLTALEKFVRNGGTAICGDPQFADYNIHGDKVDWLQKTFGVKYKNSADKKRKLDNGQEVEAFKSFITDKSVKVLEKYKNGEAALIEKNFGKGIIILSGFQLFPAADGNLDSMIAKLHKSNGGNVGQKIWRFKMPDPKIPTFQPKEGRCLTGNYGYWDRHRFFAGAFQNDAIPWTCTIVKNGTAANSSKLFDRLSYFKRQKDFKRGPVNVWVEEFSAGKHSVTFRTNKVTDITELVLYFAGTCSAMTVETSSDGKLWKNCFSRKGLSASELEVKRLSVPIAGKMNQVRISFTIPAGQKLTIAEAELWNTGKN